MLSIPGQIYRHVLHHKYNYYTNVATSTLYPQCFDLMDFTMRDVTYNLTLLMLLYRSDVLGLYSFPRSNAEPDAVLATLGLHTTYSIPV